MLSQAKIGEVEKLVTANPKKGPDVFVVFGLFIALACLIVLIMGIPSADSSDSSDSSSSAGVPITESIGDKDGVRNSLLDEPLSGAINMDAYANARIQGEDVLGNCPRAYTVREGANCIYNWIMSQETSNGKITANDIKTRLQPGSPLPYIIRQLFPAQAYANLVTDQIVWLATQDERHGVTYSQY